MKIGFIGAGNMATAIIGGLVGSGFEKKNIFVFDVMEDKLSCFADMGLSVSDSALSLTESSDIIVLAVKPQQYGEVIRGISSAASMEKTFVSIAAGITVDYVRGKLGINAPVVRVMPNTPLLVGKGATALSPSENVGEVLENLINGNALNKFYEMIEMQGGDIEKMIVSDKVVSVKSKKSGFVKKINTIGLGEIVRKLGGGRYQKEDDIDPTVGIVLTVKQGDYVLEDEEILKVYINDKDISIDEILNCFEIDNTSGGVLPLVYELVK